MAGRDAAAEAGRTGLTKGPSWVTLWEREGRGWKLRQMPDITVAPIRVEGYPIWHVLYRGKHVAALDYAENDKIAREMAWEYFDARINL